MPDFVPPARSDDSWRLLLFAHPRCPCTRATLRELARIVAYCGPGVDYDLFLYQPSEAGDEWFEDGLWASASRIRHLRIHPDPDGTLARRCGALTSGHALLFDADGRLRFEGGLTVGRGHEGDNAGVDAILRIAAARPGSAARQSSAEQVATHLVFGCPIQDAEEPWACRE